MCSVRTDTSIMCHCLQPTFLIIANSFSQYLWSVYNVSGIIVVSKDTVINKTSPLLQGAHSLIGETGTVYDKLLCGEHIRGAVSLTLGTSKDFWRRNFQNGNLKENLGQEK